MTTSESAVARQPDEGDAALRPDSPLLYDEGYYRNYEGGSYDRGGHWTRFFGAIADEVIARWNPKVTLDAGCALGVFVEEFRKRGVEGWGMDISQFAIDSMPDELRAYCRQGSLADGLHADLPTHFDLISCIEVLEHMNRAEADRAIAVLCAVSDRILFSSTPDGFGEPTHFNCRAPEEWSAVFAANGFFREYDSDASFLAPWAVVYSRRDDMTTFKLALEYDRAYSRLREEVRQLRASVIELDKKASASDAEVLKGEITQLRADALAARDDAVGIRGEMERVRAEAREIEVKAEERMRQTRTWRVGRVLLGPVDVTRRAAQRLRQDQPPR